MEQFFNSQSIIEAIIKIFVLVGAGYLLYLFKIFKRETGEQLSAILLWATLPALIFYKITHSFKPSVINNWWLFPVYSLLLILFGVVLGFIFSRLLKNFNSKREYIAATAFQNVGYLPIALTVFVCSGDFCDTVLIYIFLFLIGFNIAMWGLLPTYLSGKPFRESFNLHSIINPPLVAAVLGLAVVFFIGENRMPSVINDSLSMLGNATFPLALLVLGIFLAEHKAYMPENLFAVLSCVFVKLIIIPLAIIFFLRAIDASITMKFFIFLESIMPSAVSLIVIGSYKKADNKFLSGVVFYSHLFAILTIPAWLWVFQRIIKI